MSSRTRAPVTSETLSVIRTRGPFRSTNPATANGSEPTVIRLPSPSRTTSCRRSWVSFASIPIFRLSGRPVSSGIEEARGAGETILVVVAEVDLESDLAVQGQRSVRVERYAIAGGPHFERAETGFAEPESSDEDRASTTFVIETRGRLRAGNRRKRMAFRAARTMRVFAGVAPGSSVICGSRMSGSAPFEVGRFMRTSVKRAAQTGEPPVTIDHGASATIADRATSTVSPAASRSRRSSTVMRAVAPTDSDRHEAVRPRLAALARNRETTEETTTERATKNAATMQMAAAMYKMRLTGGPDDRGMNDAV